MSDLQPSDKRGGLLGWVIAHPKTVIALSLLLVVLLALMLFDGVAERRLQSRIAAIRARGEPTTAEDLQAAMPTIPPEENMAVALAEPMAKLSAFKIPEERSEFFPLIGSARIGPTGRRFPPEQLAAAREYLSQFPDELAAIHQALKLKQGCPEIVWQTPLIQLLLPELSVYRLMSKTLALEAAVAAEDGDTQQAAERLLDSCHVELILECKPLLITLLVRTGIIAMAEGQIERTINQCGLSDESLRRLQNDLAGREGCFDLKKALMSERVIFLDTIQSLRSGKANLGFLSGGDDDGFTGVWRHLPVLPALDASAGLDIYDGLIDAIDKPDGASLQRLRVASRRQGGLPQYNLVSRTMVPAFSRATELWVRSAGMNRAMQAALACERYRLARGDWPESLASLVPEYLATVPLDPFDGKPIRYKRIPEGIKVWSIGEDMADNGGDVLRLEVQKPSQKATDAGWVLLNPDLRGRPAEPESPATTGQAEQ
jgi:hypothetical protein